MRGDFRPEHPLLDLQRRGGDSDFEGGRDQRCTMITTSSSDRRPRESHETHQIRTLRMTSQKQEYFETQRFKPLIRQGFHELFGELGGVPSSTSAAWLAPS